MPPEPLHAPDYTTAGPSEALAQLQTTLNALAAEMYLELEAAPKVFGGGEVQKRSGECQVNLSAVIVITPQVWYNGERHKKSPVGAGL